MTSSGVPASPQRGPEVARHMSRKIKGYGVMITRQGEKFGVWNIAPIAGTPTARMFELVQTEEEARKIANREWVGMKL